MAPIPLRLVLAAEAAMQRVLDEIEAQGGQFSGAARLQLSEACADLQIFLSAALPREVEVDAKEAA